MSEVDAEPSLAEILSDAPAPEPEAKAEPEAAPEPAEPEKPQRERDESGKFKAKEPEKEPEVTEEDKPKGKPDGIAALIAERRKRQELEKQLEAVKSQQPKTDFFQDPDKAFQERFSTETAKQSERFFNMSVKLARIQPGREDYDEAAQSFVEAAEADPRLYDQLRGDEDPGEFIYTVGKQIKELADVGGDIGQYRQKVTSELQTQISERDKRLQALEAELASVKKQYEELSTVGRSLNQQGSGRSTVVMTDDDPLEDILRFGKT